MKNLARIFILVIAFSAVISQSSADTFDGNFADGTVISLKNRTCGTGARGEKINCKRWTDTLTVLKNSINYRYGSSGAQYIIPLNGRLPTSLGYFEARLNANNIGIKYFEHNSGYTITWRIISSNGKCSFNYKFYLPNSDLSDDNAAISCSIKAGRAQHKNAPKNCVSPSIYHNKDGTQCVKVTNNCEVNIAAGIVQNNKKRKMRSLNLDPGKSGSLCQVNRESALYEYTGYCLRSDINSGACRLK